MTIDWVMLGLLVVFLLIIILGDTGYVASIRFYKRELNFKNEKSYFYSPQARELFIQNRGKGNLKEWVIEQVKDDNGPGKFKSLKSKKLKSFSETMRIMFEKCLLTSLEKGQCHGWLIDVGKFDSPSIPNYIPNHIPNYIQNHIPNSSPGALMGHTPLMIDNGESQMTRGVSIESIDSISEYQPRLNQAQVYRNRKPTLDFGESD